MICLHFWTPDFIHFCNRPHGSSLASGSGAPSSDVARVSRRSVGLRVGTLIIMGPSPRICCSRGTGLRSQGRRRVALAFVEVLGAGTGTDKEKHAAQVSRFRELVSARRCPFRVLMAQMPIGSKNLARSQTPLPYIWRRSGSAQQAPRRSASDPVDTQTRANNAAAPRRSSRGARQPVNVRAVCWLPCRIA